MATVAIQLDRLVGAEIHQREVNGELCDCISIPIKWNGIACYRKNHYYLDLNMIRKAPNPKGHTHFLSVQYPPSMREWSIQAKEEGLIKGVDYVGFVSGGDGNFVSGKSKPTTIESIKNALEK